MAAFVLPLAGPLLTRPRRSTHHKRQSIVCTRVSPSSPAPQAPLTGEWAGYEASFSASGAVIPIADYYIPEEFREWGITPSGFECHTSINLTHQTLHKKHLRVLPSVSQFGDFVDIEESVRTLDLTSPGVAVFPDGCWAAGPATAGVKEGKLGKWPDVELFLRQGERGVRVMMGFDRVKGLVVGDVGVGIHDWVGEYADLGVLDGGSGYSSGWVDRGGVVEVDGRWRKENGEEIVEEGCLCLPAGLDVGVRLVNEGCLLWAGKTVEDNRLVLRRLYDGDGALVYSERLVLSRNR